MTHTSSRQSGFSLLEMMLAVGISALIIVMISNISSDLIKQRAATMAGQQMSRIAELTEDVLLRSAPSINANTGDIISNGVVTGTQFKDIALATLQNNSFPINNADFRIMGSPVEVYYANGNSSGGALMVRVAVVLKKQMPLLDALKVARGIGGRGGVIRSDTGYSNKISSAFGNWTFDLTGPLGTLLTGLGAPSANNAYVVAYSAYSQSDIKGPYLSSRSSSGGENVMHTDILMNGHSIIGAKDIDVSTLSVTKAARFDEMAVNGKANFQGGIDANDTVTVKKSLSVTEGDMSITNGDLKAPGGKISAKGLRADTLEATDLTTTDLSTENLTVEGDNSKTLITSNLTVSGDSTLDITGPLKASIVDAADITTDKMSTKSLDVKEETTLRGATTIKNTTSIDQLILDGCMQLDGKTYGTCN